MPHALVAGGAGFVGLYLTELLLKEGWSITVLDNFSRGQFDHIPDGCLVANMDVRDVAPETLRAAGIDAVFDLAARVYGVRDLYKDPGELLADNLEITSHLVRSAVRAGIKRYTYISSSCVYDFPAAQVPHKEEDIGLCNTSYGLSKITGEELCRYFTYRSDLRVGIVRLFNVFGPKDSWQSAHVIPDMMRKAWRLATGKADVFPIIGDGQQTRDFTYATDVARGILAVAEKGHDGKAYNLGTGREISVLALAHLVLACFDLDPAGVTFAHEEAPKEDIRRRSAYRLRALEDLGWEPTVTLEDGLKIVKAAIVPELEKQAAKEAEAAA